MFIKIFFYINLIISALSLEDCLTCNKSICQDGTRASYWLDDKCVFDSNSTFSSVFVTGEILALGACAAVQQNVNKDCYNSISESVIENLGSITELFNDKIECSLFPDKTPCMYSAKKFFVDTKGYDCSQLSLLYEQAIDKCLRQQPDANFWFSILYWTGLLIVIGLLGILCGCSSS